MTSYASLQNMYCKIHHNVTKKKKSNHIGTLTLTINHGHGHSCLLIDEHSMALKWFEKNNKIQQNIAKYNKEEKNHIGTLTLTIDHGHTCLLIDGLYGIKMV